MKPFAERFFASHRRRQPILVTVMGMGGVLLWLTLTAGAGETTDKPRQVLILESYGRDFAPWNDITPAFKKKLIEQSPVPIDFYEASLEPAGLNEPRVEGAFTDYLHALYARRQPDLAVLIGGAAVQYWSRHRDTLFPSTPAVICGVGSHLLRTLTLTSNEVAVAMQFDLPGALEANLRVLPDTTNFVVVVGNSPLEQFWAAQCRREFQSFSNHVQFTWFNELSFAEMLRRAATLPPHSAVLYGMLLVDAAGVPHEQMETLDRLHAVASAPLFGLLEEQLGHGIVGGELFSGAAVGRETGHVAARVLHGEAPGDIPTVVVHPGPPVYDWRELQRWHIGENRLPPGSVIRFRRPSLWRQYRWYVAGALGVMLVETLTIAALLTQRTRRRSAEVSLRESQQFMEVATAAGGLGLWVRDTTSGELRVNPRLRSLFALTDEQPVHWEDIFARVHPDDRAQAELAMQRVLREGGAFEFEARVRQPGSVERWVAVKGLAAQDARGRTIRTEGVVFDITARHDAELAAQRHRNELRHIGRVHVLGQLSSALAHELNQPLGAILSNAEAAELLLQGNHPPWEEVRAILADIRKDDQRASDVIHRVRGLLRRHEMELTPLSAGELVEECIALARPDALERNVTVQSVVLPGVSRTRGDRVHLEQVLLNLLVNGMDAMRDCPVERRRLTVCVQRAGDHTVQFSVADSGTGIPPDQLDQIFDSFYTTKLNGLGLGLSISRAIIEAHHGRIWAENNPNGGATIHFVLPTEEDRE